MFIILATSILLAFSLTLPSSAQTWNELIEHADSLFSDGYQDSAIVLGNLALKKAEAKYNESDTVNIKILIRLAHYNKIAGYDKQVDIIIKKAFSRCENHFQVENIEIIRFLNIIARSFMDLFYYDSPKTIYENTLMTAENFLGPLHHEISNSLFGISDCNAYLREYDKIVPLINRAIDIEKQLPDPNYDTIAYHSLDLSAYYNQNGNFEQSEYYIKSALFLIDSIYGNKHLTTIRYMDCLANFYNGQGRYREADSISKIILNTKIRHLGEDHQSVADSYFSIGIYNYNRTEYKKAELYLLKAINIYDEKLYPFSIARCYLSLADSYRAQGIYYNIEPYYYKALDLFKKVYGPQNWWEANVLNSLAIYHYRIGQYKKAEPLLKNALEIRENIFGSDSWDLRGILKDLVDLYDKLEMYTKACEYNDRLYTISINTFDEDHPSIALTLNQRAVFLKKRGETFEAEKLHFKALDILHQHYDSSHPSLGFILKDLAALYCEIGEYNKASNTIKNALAELELWYGSENHFLIKPLNIYSFIEYQQSNFREAFTIATKGLEISHLNIAKNINYLSEQNALTMIPTLRQPLDNLIGYYLDLDSLNVEDNLTVADGILSSKSLIFDAIVRRNSLFSEVKDTCIQILTDSLKRTQDELSQLYSNDYDDDINSLRNKINLKNILINKLDSELSRKYKTYVTQFSLKKINLKDITSVLNKNSILLEFIKFNHLDSNFMPLIPNYAIMVIDQMNSPAIITLGEASIIDSTILIYRDHLRRISSQNFMPTAKDYDEYEAISNRLYELVWKPIDKHLDDKELVYIAPDGELNLISFAGLVDDNGKYLIEKYPIHYLSAGRDLVRFDAEIEKGQGLLALGNPDFDAPVEARLDSGDTVYLASVDTDPYQTRNVRSSCGNLREIRSLPLPHTHAEIDNVMANWNAIENGSSIVFFGSQASEDNFKNHAAGKRVIHLATHGYYLEGLCNQFQDYYDFSKDKGFVGENPLLLSGLLFAGSDLHGEGADSAGLEDGYLSAYEVSAMDLSGTDMVVLSACETGLGEVKQGEGVYGLRRAFQLAGARTVVSSLWQVPDKTTAEMMSQLYQEPDRPIYERIREMQLSRIKNLREEGFSDHPYNWAAFIAIGDWRQ